MRLQQQETLYFQNEKSDKIYQVDLCEVTGGMYLVNFRYGRRGKPLREGTKTDQPIALAAARKVFDKLVAEKIKKGYSTSGTPAPAAAPPVVVDTSLRTEEPETVTPFNFELNPARKSAILNAIQEIINKSTLSDSNRSGSLWNTFKKVVQNSNNNQSNESSVNGFPKSNSGRTIERLVWRVGELRIKEAIPLLLNLVTSKDHTLLNYNLVWAIGRCGDPAGMPKLEIIRRSLATIDPLYPMVKEAQMALMSETEQKELAGFIEDTLPPVIKNNLSNGPALGNLLLQDDAVGNTARLNISNLYLMSKFNEPVKNAIFYFVDKTPLTGNGFFKAFRQIFKAAEFRADAELFGLMAYRIQKTPGNFNANSWRSIRVNNRYVQIKKELKKPDSTIAFSVQTKNYLVRRIARMLRNKGAVADPEYIKMATGILQYYKDSDEVPLHSETFYSYVRNTEGRWDSIKNTLHYTSTTAYSIFNEILYANSPRYVLSKGRQKLLFRENIDKNSPLPTEREEAYPELWDRLPQGFLQLLVNSESRLVHEFAIKAARANHRKVLGLINSEFVILLLKKSYADTLQYAVELARSVYRPALPDFNLISALLYASLDQARQLAIAWMNENTNAFLSNEEFMVAQLFNPAAEVAEWCKRSLTNHHLAEEKSLTLIAQSVAKMLQYNATATTADRNAILNAGGLLSQHFQKPLSHTSFKIINELLAHPVPAVAVFGAKILLNYQTPPEELPEDLLLGLINGDTAELRAVGIQLLGKLPDENLANKRDLMLGLALSQHANIRQDIQPIVKRIAEKNNDFAKNMVLRLAPWLMKKQVHEGCDEDLVKLLSKDLKNHLQHLAPKLMLDLLYSARKPAHTIGYLVLKNHGDGEKLTMRQIVQLGSNELVDVRIWVMNYYKKQPERIKYELPEAVRLLDARWEDSRDFTMDFLRDSLVEKDWTPDVLVSICDSVNPMIRQFGREQITKFFKAEYGEQYLLQLSQHPSGDLQNFATNYLDHFAADKPQNIEKLEPYFTTVLAGVNKAGVAKKRIFNFLHQEGLKDKKSATIIAGVIARQSASMAITDKARCLEIMRDLRKVYPKISLPAVKIEFTRYPIAQSPKI